MALLTAVIRYFFGLWMLINGIDFYYNLFPLPELNPEAMAFMAQLEAVRLYDAAKIIEIIVGILLLTNRFVPAALAACMPVTMVIFFNNIVLVGGALGLISGSVTLLLNVFLIFAYSRYFMPLLTGKARVTGAAGLREWRMDWGSSRDPGN